MRIDILTLFPEMFESPLSHSILKRAQEKKIVEFALWNIRDFTTDKYRNVDDKPYGGGAGMVMMCQPVFDCFEQVIKQPPEPAHSILLSPQGEKFDQAKAIELSKAGRLVLISGRYEGFDERTRTGLGAEEISIGDYILSGGELAAMIIVDAVVRLLSGVLGDEDSAKNDSFGRSAAGGLEYPQYTRPEVFRDMKVPQVLLSGDHKKIAEWRRQKAFEKTRSRRPDLLNNAQDKNA